MREAMRPAPALASSKAISHYLAARRAELAGDHVEARRELELAAAFDPTDAHLRAALAEALARIDKLELAEGEARRAVELDRNGPGAAEGHLVLAKLAILRERRDRALVELRESTRIEAALADASRAEAEGTGESPAPPRAEPFRLLAQVELEAGDQDAAAAALERLAALDPTQPGGAAELGRALLERKDAAGAERWLTRAVTRWPRDAASWRRLGAAQELRREERAAAASWEKALAIDPDDLSALSALGRLALGTGDVAGARTYHRQLLAVAPDDAGARVEVAFAWLDAHRAAEGLGLLDEAGDPPRADDGRVPFARGTLLQGLRRWADAAAAFGRVPPADELFAAARANQGWCLAHQGRTREALAALAPALAAKPRDVRLETMQAYVLTRAGRGAEAATRLESAIAERQQARSAEGLPDLYEALGTSLARAGRMPEALAAVRRGLAARPGDEVLLYALGALTEEAGDAEAAVARMRELLKANPDHADALNFIAYSEAERGVSLDEAERLVRRALALRPDSGAFLDTLGVIELRRGDLASAVPTLERAEALAGPDATILDHLGDAYHKAGRTADAAGAWRRSLASFEGEDRDEPQHRAAVQRKLSELPAAKARVPGGAQSVALPPGNR
jgi:Flp pilus assembly protein TadD